MGLDVTEALEALRVSGLAWFSVRPKDLRLDGTGRAQVVPTPAAGALFILPKERVHIIDVPFTQAVKVISKWGVGAGLLARGVSLRS